MKRTAEEEGRSLLSDVHTQTTGPETTHKDASAAIASGRWPRYGRVQGRGEVALYHRLRHLRLPITSTARCGEPQMCVLERETYEQQRHSEMAKESEMERQERKGKERKRREGRGRERKGKERERERTIDKVSQQYITRDRGIETTARHIKIARSVVRAPDHASRAQPGIGNALGGFLLRLMGGRGSRRYQPEVLRGRLSSREICSPKVCCSGAGHLDERAAARGAVAREEADARRAWTPYIG